MNELIKILHEILGTTTKIALCVKIIAILVFLFCAWMCANYFLQHYPEAEVTSKPFDYNGMLVGFFTLLVTLLVGWNIYSTINAKDELKNTTSKLKEQYGKDIDDMKSNIQKLQSMVSEQNIKQAEQRGAEMERKREEPSLDLQVSEGLKKWVDDMVIEKGVKLYQWAWHISDEYTSLLQIFNMYKEEKRKHPKRVLYYQERLATDEEALEMIKHARQDKLTMLKSIRQLTEQSDQKDNL